MRTARMDVMAKPPDTTRVRPTRLDDLRLFPNTSTEALDHFGKVTRSYETGLSRSGLFRCYDADGLPWTNNELEPFFGSYRYPERSCSGRKVACPGRW